MTTELKIDPSLQISPKHKHTVQTKYIPFSAQDSIWARAGLDYLVLNTLLGSEALVLCTDSSLGLAVIEDTRTIIPVLMITMSDIQHSQHILHQLRKVVDKKYLRKIKFYLQNDYNSEQESSLTVLGKAIWKDAEHIWPQFVPISSFQLSANQLKS